MGRVPPGVDDSKHNPRKFLHPQAAQRSNLGPHAVMKRWQGLPQPHHELPSRTGVLHAGHEDRSPLLPVPRACASDANPSLYVCSECWRGFGGPTCIRPVSVSVTGFVGSTALIPDVTYCAFNSHKASLWAKPCYLSGSAGPPGSPRLH